MSDPQRTCYTCGNFSLCFIRRKMDELTLDCIHFFDVDNSGKTPGFWQDLFMTLASICTEYKFKKEE